MLKAIKDAMTDSALDRFFLSFDNTYVWNVSMPSASFIDDAPQLYTDLETYAERFQKKACVQFEIIFPDEFQRIPPFVRLVTPRFQQRTGHITAGGSICTELLTEEGWNKNKMSPQQLILFLHNLIIDGHARLDTHSPHCPYLFVEAIDAFNRVASDHGWKGLQKAHLNSIKGIANDEGIERTSPKPVDKSTRDGKRKVADRERK